MKRWLMASLLFLLCLALAVLPLTALLFSGSSNAGSPALDLPFYVKEGEPHGEGALRFVPGEVLVKLKRGVSEVEAVSLRGGHGIDEAYVSRFGGVRRWRVPVSRSVEEWAALLSSSPLVEYAEPNYVFYASMTPNDPGFGFQWHLDNAGYGGVHAKAAWDMATGSQRVVVAVVDSGVAFEDCAAPARWHIDTYNAYSGHSWWCGVSSAPYSWTALYGASPAPPGYGNGWREYLQRAFDLRSATGAVTFSYQYRYHLQNGYDYVYVEVSSDGGYSWVQRKSYTGPVVSSQVRWRSDSVDLSGYKGSEVLVRFRVFSNDEQSDEDGLFNSNGGAFSVDEIRLTHGGGTLFFDDVESGTGGWVTTAYEQAPDFAGTGFWMNGGEVAGNGLDDDGNGFVDDVSGWDFVNQDAHPNDDAGHGTHVAGTIAQTTGNGFGVAGLAFGVSVMPVKVLNSAGTGTFQWVADGIYYATDNGADIINLSLGSSGHSETVQDAVAYAYAHGVTVVAASGNRNVGTVDFPAAYDAYVIAVGATQYNEARAPYSNYGSSLDLVAPGGNTGVDQNGDGYADGVLQNTFSNTTVDWAYWFWQGTSMATPHVSGLAALILTRNPSLTPDGVRSVLQSTADDLGTAGRDNTFGYGLVNAEAALRSMAQPVHLWLSVDPVQATYSRGQSLALSVTVFNEQNPAFNSSLTLTVTGPGGYYQYYTQAIAVAADEVRDYGFSWAVPQVTGTYVVEVGLVPAQLTAYDAAWLVVS